MSGGMNFELTEDQELIRRSVAELCARFDDHYWMDKDLAHEFPREFYDAIAAGGWLGMTIPEEYGGGGLGITEATVMMQAISQSGAGLSGASSVHMNIFGLQPVAVGEWIRSPVGAHGISAFRSRVWPPQFPRGSGSVSRSLAPSLSRNSGSGF